MLRILPACFDALRPSGGVKGLLTLLTCCLFLAAIQTGLALWQARDSQLQVVHGMIHTLLGVPFVAAIYFAPA